MTIREASHSGAGRSWRTSSCEKITENMVLCQFHDLIELYEDNLFDYG